MERFDIFGAPVGLIYKGDSAFKSKFGGLITITFIVLIIVLFYSSVRNSFVFLTDYLILILAFVCITILGHNSILQK